MNFQEIIVLIIVVLAVVFSVYKLFKIFISKEKSTDHCNSCPYSIKDGGCSK